MAGHSKWSTIKRKKAVNDARRGKLFTGLIREITVAARAGGGDPNFNPRLRLAIDSAREANMPAENIERAVKRGTGELEGVDYEEITYEGYGPGGVAIYIETLTDNANRTVAEIRHILSRNGGSLGTSGSVAWQFDRKGQIYISASRYDEESLLIAALEAGAEDMQQEDDSFVISTDPAAFHTVQDALREHGITADEAELAMVPNATIEIAGDDAARLLKLLELLDEADDVQKISSNADIDEAAIQEAASG